MSKESNYCDNMECGRKITKNNPVVSSASFVWGGMIFCKACDSGETSAPENETPSEKKLRKALRKEADRIKISNDALQKVVEKTVENSGGEKTELKVPGWIKGKTFDMTKAVKEAAEKER